MPKKFMTFDGTDIDLYTLELIYIRGVISTL